MKKIVLQLIFELYNTTGKDEFLDLYSILKNEVEESEIKLENVAIEINKVFESQKSENKFVSNTTGEVCNHSK